jgi:hypothetical protein
LTHDGQIRLTPLEIEALLAAAGNADPAMWEDYPDEKHGDRLHDAWLSRETRGKLFGPLRLQF